MADIQNFPELDKLEQRLGQLFKDTVQFLLEDPDLAAQVAPEEVTAQQIEFLSDEIRSLRLDEIIVFSSWANDNATISETELILGFIISIPEQLLDIEDPTESDTFIAARDLIANVIDIQDITWDLFNEWFDGFDIDIAYEENRTEFISYKINITDSVQAYNLTDDTDIQIVEGEPEFVGGPPTTIVEEIPAGAREPIPEEEVEPDEVEPEEPEPEPEPEPEEPELEPVPPPEEEVEPPEPPFPEVPDPLRPFAVAPDRIDVPTGKETKSVEPRPIFDWEQDLASPQGDLDGGIGEAMRVGDDEDEDTFGMGISPGTFPRTGAYIKYHLLNEGPSYVLEMYNDLVIYSAFISTLHSGTFRPGRYDSFRAYLNRVRLISERGGPELIEQLSPQQASSRGLEQIADHPTIDGEKAPWLERRIYYDVIEENINNPAWNDIVGFLSQLTV